MYSMKKNVLMGSGAGAVSWVTGTLPFGGFRLWKRPALLLQMAALLCIWMAGAGCALKDPEPLEYPPALPESWSADMAMDGELPENDWWRSFRSGGLEELLEEALSASPDLTMAVERVMQAESQLRITGASLFPSLNLSGGSSWRRNRASGGKTVSTESTTLSMGASYEVDVWGKLAADMRASGALLHAAEYDRDAVRLSLMAGVASGYFQVLALEERLQISRSNLAIARRVLAFVESRYRHGSATELDLKRQQSAVLSQESTLLSLEEQYRQQRSALAILVGHPPQSFDPGTEAFCEIIIPQVTAYMPSELLLRRPDIARAEAQLAASAASVTVAKTAFLPSFQLSGSAGLASTALVSLASPDGSLSLSAAIAQTLFDAGRRENQVAAAESRLREQVESYRKSILTVLKEVEDGLNRADFSGRQISLQEAIVEKAARSLVLAELRYREGADDLLTLLDAQRSLFQARDQMVQLRLAGLDAALDLYKVLGGGWERRG
ncbi:NodT family efflux transporter outer membrane factor (OMF) lipoprotein [Desulfobotulus alkaliphilus]|uniref:NodT family efflux transporter outer membrane factor (OMF) lipoprotein n=1 Tax=Desulfobotulus alkaliphilus TaxID=622671 RepID=A0A562S608_9BACT|nr:efflux transporter outer membrane subunit [Desulfobotulus alkaliphilus]TWI76732.1 NodT family efflux transporter outer membrane factor (OMF) lipoprotein [Desulfobotulus alkaliphilus]